MSKLFVECERCGGMGGTLVKNEAKLSGLSQRNCPDCDGMGRIPFKAPKDVQALARAVTDNVTQFGTEQNNVANMITAFIKAQKPEIPKDIKTMVHGWDLWGGDATQAEQEIAAFCEKQPADIEALVDEYFQEYHVNAVATLPHSCLDDPIEAADDQKERDYLAAKIAAFCEEEIQKEIKRLAAAFAISQDGLPDGIELHQEVKDMMSLRAEVERLRGALRPIATRSKPPGVPLRDWRALQAALKGSGG